MHLVFDIMRFREYRSQLCRLKKARLLESPRPRQGRNMYIGGPRAFAIRTWICCLALLDAFGVKIWGKQLSDWWSLQLFGDAFDIEFGQILALHMREHVVHEHENSRIFKKSFWQENHPSFGRGFESRMDGTVSPRDPVRETSKGQPVSYEDLPPGCPRPETSRRGQDIWSPGGLCLGFVEFPSRWWMVRWVRDAIFSVPLMGHLWPFNDIFHGEIWGIYLGISKWNWEKNIFRQLPLAKYLWYQLLNMGDSGWLVGFRAKSVSGLCMRRLQKVGAYYKSGQIIVTSLWPHWNHGS